MSLVDINWHPTPRELRKFGLIMLIGFALIGCLFRFAFGYPLVAWICWGVGAGTGLLGLTGLPIALPVYRAWYGIAFVLGNVISRVLMVLLWFGPVTLTALVMKLCRRDALHRRRRDAATYWVDLPPPPAERERYERQF